MFTKKFSQSIAFVALSFVKIWSNFTALAEKKKPEPEGYGSTKNSFGSESGKLEIRQGRIRKTAPMCTYDNHKCTRPQRYIQYSTWYAGMRIQIRIPLFTLMRIRVQIFTFMQILILLLVKVTRIWDQWSTDPPEFHFEPSILHCKRPRLHFEPLKLFNFDINTDSDPASKK